MSRRYRLLAAAAATAGPVPGVIVDVDGLMVAPGLGQCRIGELALGHS